jgi:hypothetical protein
MNHRQQKQFRQGSISATNRQVDFPLKLLIWVVRKTIRLLEYLLVIGKYQLYKRTAIAPSSVGIPWSKMFFIGIVAFFVFRKDYSNKVESTSGITHFGTIEPSFLPGEAKDAPIVKLASLFESEDPFAVAPDDDEKTKNVKAYIRRFRTVAEAENEKFGIPASVKMAQAIIESQAGTSKLSQKNRNHFGVKCFSKSCNKGHCSNFGDDSHKDFFRKYETNWESWRAHSLLIVNGKYKKLLKHGEDYKKWARGLKELGYATAKHYDNTLINTIEKYRLDLLDN